MKRLNTITNNRLIKKNFLNRLKYFIFIIVLIFISCDSGEWNEKAVSSLTTITAPSGYLQVSVFPGDIESNIGEQVAIDCSIMSLISTPVEIHSVDLVLFDSSDSLIRKEPMNLENYWSANVTYIIVGDESSYRFLIDFSINPSNPEYFSEYTDAYTIKAVSSLTTITAPSGYLQVSVFPGDIESNIGEQVAIDCSIMSLINTPVEIHSVDLVLFDSSDSLIRKEPMNLENYWSANVTYIIVGDESSYRFLIDFSINPSNPEYFSEYTDAYTIKQFLP